MSKKEETKKQEKTAPGFGWYLRILLLGVFFGIVLSKAEVARWQRVHDMFLFKELHMYLIIGIGVTVGAISILLIRQFGVKSIDGEAIKLKPKPFHKGLIFGGTIFGMGWAIAGVCPGPIFVHIGAGEWLGLFALAGAMVGLFGYAALKPVLPH